MSKNYVQIDPKDNIIVAITPLEKGVVTQVAGKQVVLKENIKQKHKYSLYDFNIGDEIYMYGVLIGKAMQPILEGCAITIENVKHASAEFQDSKEKFTWKDWSPKDIKDLPTHKLACDKSLLIYVKGISGKFGIHSDECAR